MKQITRAKLKYLKGLGDKKSRQVSGLFLAEGLKMVQEGMKAGWACTDLVIADSEIGAGFQAYVAGDIWRVSQKEIEQISSLKNPEPVLAVFRVPNDHQPDPQTQSLLLDGIKDPGNLGTLIRTADWFGVRQILASKETADCYNPKVLRASMGSIFRVNIFYLPDFQSFCIQNASEIWMGDLEGNPPETMKNENRRYLLLGGESKGVSSDLLSLKKVGKIKIPGGGAESLNVAVAGGILLHSWKN